MNNPRVNNPGNYPSWVFSTRIAKYSLYTNLLTPCISITPSGVHTSALRSGTNPIHPSYPWYNYYLYSDTTTTFHTSGTGDTTQTTVTTTKEEMPVDAVESGIHSAFCTHLQHARAFICAYSGYLATGLLQSCIKALHV